MISRVPVVVSAALSCHIFSTREWSSGGRKVASMWSCRMQPMCSCAMDDKRSGLWFDGSNRMASIMKWGIGADPAGGARSAVHVLARFIQ